MTYSGPIRRNFGATVRDFLASGKKGDARPDGCEGEHAGSEPDEDRRDTAPLPSSPDRSPAAAARAALMERIARFLVGHDLDISPANLLRAHALFAGDNPECAAIVEEMETRGEPITQRWLDAIASPVDESPDERAEVETLATTLQTAIAAFATTARDARSAAADYRSAIDEQAQEVSRIHSREAAEQLLARVGELTRAIRDRTQQAEDKMQRSEREAMALRKDLEEAQRAANIDHLTGLPNRRALDAMLEGSWSDTGGISREPVVVAFCDIDNFKPVNDIHGHDTGDRVLQMVARTLTDGAGDDCQVVRYGGEEFVVLYRGLALDDAFDNLDTIRAMLAKRPFVDRLTREPLGTITFSGGVADLSAYPDYGSALKAADEALYRAKRDGRNRIARAAPPPV